MLDTVQLWVVWFISWALLTLGGLLCFLMIVLAAAWVVDLTCRRLQCTWRFAVYMTKRDTINAMIMQLPNGEYRQFARRDLPVRIEEVVKERDTAYTERVRLLAVLAMIYDSAMVRDENARGDDWEWILFIELPTGQASWHIHINDLRFLRHVAPAKKPLGRWEWDGHSTETKYQRIQALVDSE